MMSPFLQCIMKVAHVDYVEMNYINSRVKIIVPCLYSFPISQRNVRQVGEKNLKGSTESSFHVHFCQSLLFKHVSSQLMEIYS